MYAFVVFVGLALALAVVSGVLDEVLPIKAPRALSTTMTVVVAILVAWGLDYSVFRAFGQDLRAEWMNPVATGVVLVGAGEFLRAIAASFGLSISLGHRDRTKAACRIPTDTARRSGHPPGRRAVVSAVLVDESLARGLDLRLGILASGPVRTLDALPGLE